MTKLFTKISLLFIGLMLFAGNAWATGTYHDPEGTPNQQQQIQGDGYYEISSNGITYRVDYTATVTVPLNMVVRTVKKHNNQYAYIHSYTNQPILLLQSAIDFVATEMGGNPMNTATYQVAIDPGTFTEYNGIIYLPTWNKTNANNNVIYVGTNGSWPVWEDVFGPNANVMAQNRTDMVRYSKQNTSYLHPVKGVYTPCYYWKGHIGNANMLISHNIEHEGDFGTGLHWALYDNDSLAITGNGDMPNYSYGGDAPWYSYKNDILFVGIGSGITKVGNYAFGDWNYTNMYSVSFGEGSALTEIGNNAFYYAGIYEVTLPAGLEQIGNSAFSYCRELPKITIPSTVTNLGQGVFSNCDSLRTVAVNATTPPAIDKNGTSLFSSSPLLQTVVIPEGTVCDYSDSENWGYSLGGLYEYKYSIDGDNQDCGKRTCGENLYWSVNPETHTLIIYGEGTTMSNYTTSNNPQWYGFRNNIYAVTFNTPNLTNIGEYAFYNCQYIREAVEIPSSVTTIGNFAFNGCSNLPSVTIPKAVTTIGNYAFQSNNNLCSVVFESGSALTTIGNSAFSQCGRYSSSNTVINIPEGVVSIGSSAFSSCSKMASFTLPESVTSVGSGAFSSCSLLTEPIYNSRIFAYMPNAWLTEEHAPSGAYAIPDGIETIVGSAFSSCTNLQSLTIPETVTSIGSSAFSSCSNLQTINIPNSVTNIESYTFQNCSHLASIDIPNSVTNIGSSAFYGCSNLTSIDIPNSVTNMAGSSVFRNCTSLTSVKLPAGLTAIPSITFRGCTNLSKLYLKGALVTSVGANSFRDITATITIYVPKGTRNNYQSIFESNASSAYLTTTYTIEEDNAMCTFSDDDAATTNATLVSLLNEDMESVASVRPAQKGGQYNTLCLPFSLTAEQIAKSSLMNAEIFKFSGATLNGDELELYFQPVTALTAGVPYFFRYMEEGANLSMLAFSDVTITTSEGSSVTHNGVSLIGTLDQVSVSGTGKLYLAANNELHWSSTAKTINPFRAYFSVAGLPAGVPPRARIVERENVATEVESVPSSAINSQKIIENGQLFILKNGVKYNAQGQIVK